MGVGRGGERVGAARDAQDEESGPRQGSGKKPYRQKGTGRARVSDIRNPLWRHGGTVFGPHPRSYAYSLPRKVERGALRAALAAKLREGAVDRCRRLRLETPDQSGRRARVAAGRDGQTLVMDVNPEESVTRARNLAASKLVVSGRVTARDVVDARAHRDAGRDRAAAGGAGDAAAGKPQRRSMPSLPLSSSLSPLPPTLHRRRTETIMSSQDVIRRPLITEKTTVLREEGLTLVLEVAAGATKVEIARRWSNCSVPRWPTCARPSRTGSSSARVASSASDRTGRKPTSG